MNDIISYMPIEAGTKDFIRIIESQVDRDLILGIIAKMRIGGFDNNGLNRIHSVLSALDEEVRANREDNFMLKLLLGSPEKNDLFFRKSRFVRLAELIEEFGLKGISSSEWVRIHRDALRILEQNEPSMCWFPNCSNTSSSVISAHSIQRGLWLNNIKDKLSNEVWTLPMYRRAAQNEIKVQSTFRGFCDIHDKPTFKPIEDCPYSSSIEQQFLYAYRAFAHSSHMLYKYERIQEVKKNFSREISLNKKIFDNALVARTYSEITTHEVHLKRYYPIAAAGAFHLYCDFFEDAINHEENRLAKIFLSVLPDLQNNRTIVLISYFSCDRNKYGNILNQLMVRGRLEEDLSTLIVGLMQNVYFNPTYYSQVIERQSEKCFQILEDMPKDYIAFGTDEVSVDVHTDYLSNPIARVNLFPRYSFLEPVFLLDNRS